MLVSVLCFPHWWWYLGECTRGLPLEWVAYPWEIGGDMIVISFGLKEGTCAPIMNIMRTGKSSHHFGFFQDLEVGIDWLSVQGHCHWLAYCGIHLALEICQLPQTPHSYICLRSYCDPLGGHIIKPSFPSGISSNFWCNLSVLICMFCQMLLNACLFCSPYQFILLLYPCIFWDRLSTVVLGQSQPVIPRCLSLMTKH